MILHTWNMLDKGEDSCIIQAMNNTTTQTPTVIEPPFTDDDFKSLMERNSQRLAAAIIALGEKHLIHPKNQVKKKKKPRKMVSKKKQKEIV